MGDYEHFNENASMSNKYNTTYYDYYFDIERSTFEFVLIWFETAFVVPIGVLGNIFVICVLRKKSYEKSSTAVFFSALAVSDIVILVSGLYNIFTVNIDGKIDCQIVTSLWICSGQASSCILAIVAVERAVSVLYPHQAKFIFTVASAKFLMVMVFSFIFVLNTILIVWYDIVGDMFFEAMYCPTDDKLQSSIVHVFPWIDFCLGFAIPFIVIAISSAIIIKKLRSAISGQKDGGKISSVTKTLLSANACFLVLLAPSRIYNIMYPIPLLDEIGFKLFHLLSTISQLNAAANFFVYFMNADIFRADVKDLLCCTKSRTDSTRDSSLVS